MTEPDLITLKQGLVVPVALLKRLWALEDRGLHFTLEADALLVSPMPLLTDEDCAFLRAHKGLIAEIVTYCAQVQAS